MSFSGLEEKVLEQYTFAKANVIRTAALSYLLDSGVKWASVPAVKGVRDAAVELLHTLVAVHAEVFAGAKPLLDKTLGILVEGLIDTFLSLFNENPKELTSIDTNGFCQLMLELEYYETILNPYFTSVARGNSIAPHISHHHHLQEFGAVEGEGDVIFSREEAREHQPRREAISRRSQHDPDRSTRKPRAAPWILLRR